MWFKKYNIDQLHVLLLWLKTNNLITKILTQLLFAKGTFGEYIDDNDGTFFTIIIIQTILTDFSTIIQAEIFKILNQEILDVPKESSYLEYININ